MKEERDYNYLKSAFPTPESEWNQDGKGLTKREYMATHILCGIVSDYDAQSKVNGRLIPFTDYPELAANAVQLADALLKQLKN